MYVCEDVGVGFVGLSFGDGEIVDDDIGEFYLAHGVECHCRARFNLYVIHQNINISISWPANLTPFLTVHTTIASILLLYYY